MPTPWPPAHPLLCLVTDRLALAAALGGATDAREALRRQVVVAVEAAVDLVHVRERDLEAGALADLVADCAVLAAGSETRIVVNDRLDVALVAGADGVHLRNDSVETHKARAIVPDGFLLGRSVRGVGDLVRAEGADYLVLGTVYSTPSKPRIREVVGRDGIAEMVRTAGVPVLAIGGVSQEKLPELAGAGASGFAAIRMFFEAAREDGTAFRRRVREWRRTFDMHRSIS